MPATLDAARLIAASAVRAGQANNAGGVAV